jgi:hypothetical protein
MTISVDGESSSFDEDLWSIHSNMHLQMRHPRALTMDLAESS